MRVAALVLAVALPVAAQSPANFRSSAEVTMPSNDALHLLELPVEVFRDGRKDLADVRIYNEKGDSVPIAWGADPGRTVEPAQPIVLPVFPVRTVPAPGQASTEVTVKAADGTLVSVRSGRAPPAKGAPKAKAWLADVTKATEPIAAVLFTWEAVPGSEMLTVRVEGSDDLKAWSTLGSAPLVRLQGGGRSLLQNRVEFTPRTVKYLRITADSPAFEPTNIGAQYAPRGKPPERRVKTVEATRGENPDEIVFDLGARLPVELLRLIPTQDNAILVGNLLARDTTNEPWQPMMSATFYRLQREGVESLSPPREIGRRAARYWLVRLAPGSSQGPLPKLEVHWSPARIVFVKEGEGPFYLAFGNPNAKQTALGIETVIPNYKPGMEHLLKAAQVGPVKAEPPPNRWEKMIGEMDLRRSILWGVLVLGVATLGVMAWRLSKQVK
jgi:hypothetical protein